MAYNVHPVIRVICFIIFALSLALGPVEQVLLGSLMVMVLYFFTGLGVLRQAWPMLRRMRWFFFSILLIYLLMSPTEGAQGSGDGWVPSWDGLYHAGHRILALVLMILAVHWLLSHTSRQALISALYRLVFPLSLLGLSRERFAVRMMLVFELMEPVQEKVSQQVAERKAQGKDLRAYANVAAELTCDVIANAEKAECHSIEIDVSDAPTPFQWGWVVMLTFVVCLPVIW